MFTLYFVQVAANEVFARLSLTDLLQLIIAHAHEAAEATAGTSAEGSTVQAAVDIDSATPSADIEDETGAESTQNKVKYLTFVA